MNTVTSSDGTRIAYERTGEGPPLVLVHGGLNDRNAWAGVVPLFAERFTVFAMDRRGRGESGAPAEHAIEREFEDVCAVIDAAGPSVDLIGHSYGAHCALGAASSAPGRVKHLVLYEPPPLALVSQLAEQEFENKEAPEAIARFFRNTIGVPPEQVEALRASPFWSYFVSHAPSMAPEVRALRGYDFDPKRFVNLTMPVLFLIGSETGDRLGAALRDVEPYVAHAEWHTFEGQGHAAMRMAPPMFAEAVLSFLSR
jgi:pimeloyl-ACP methyl ester carboxylesterase